MYSRRGAGDPIHAFLHFPCTALASYADLGPAYDTYDLEGKTRRERLATLLFAGVPAAVASVLAGYTVWKYTPTSRSEAQGMSKDESLEQVARKPFKPIAGKDQLGKGWYAKLDPAKPQTKPKPIPVVRDTRPRAPPALGMPPKRAGAMGRNRMISAPVSKTLGQRQAVETVKFSGDDLIIHRREYLMDIDASTAYTVSSIPISPVAWPWALRFASMFETYVIMSCAFEYVPQTSTNAGGFLLFAPDFDPSDTHTALEGKAELLNMKSAVVGPLWNRIRCTMQPKDLQKRKTLYVGVPTTTAESQRMHYAGNVWIGIVGASNYQAVGEIWVEYTIRFSTPQMINLKSGEGASRMDTARCSGTSNAAPFGAASTYAEGGIPATFTSTGTTTSVTTFTFQLPWSGYCTIVFTTAAGIASIGLTGTATTTGNSAEIHEFASALGWFGWIDAVQGQTLIFTIANTDIATCDAYFVRGGDVRA